MFARFKPSPVCSYDANGNRAGQAGPTPLLRQQLLGSTPAGLSAAAAAAGAASAPRSGVPAAAATPLEVKALRDEVKALREETAALRLQVRCPAGAGQAALGGLLGHASVGAPRPACLQTASLPCSSPWLGVARRLLPPSQVQPLPK